MRLGTTSLSVTKSGRKRKKAVSGGGGGGGGTPVNVSYKYHAYGAGVNFTRVYWVTSSGYNLLRTITGQQQTVQTAAWNTYVDDLTPYRGTTGKVAWVYVTNSLTQATNANNYTQDVGFDDMKINNADQASGVIDYSPTYASTHLGWINQQYSLPAASDVITQVNATTTATENAGNALQRDPGVSSNRRYYNTHTGATPSQNTGPMAAADGSLGTYYVVYESTSGSSATNNRYEVLTTSSTVTLL